MASQRSRSPKQSARKQVLPLVLIGVGLLMFGIVAFILMPKEAPAASQNDSEGSVTPAEVNFAAPVLELNDLKGQPVSLSDYRGQVVLVNNWATWCPPCKAEMPVLQQYYEEHKDQGFTLIAIEAGEPVQEVADFAESYQLSFPVWPDPNQKALAAFRQFTLPNSFVIDRSGSVRLAWLGAINLAALEKYVTPLIEE